MTIKDMTPEQIKALERSLYYMTQYANGYSDQGFYDELLDAWSTQDFDIDAITDALSHAPSVSDKINEIIFEEMWVLDDAKIERIHEILETVADVGVNGITDIVDFDIYETDSMTGDMWWEIIDADLKEAGLDSPYIYLVDDLRRIEFARWYQPNGYWNKLEEVDIEDLFYDYGGLALIRDYIAG